MNLISSLNIYIYIYIYIYMNSSVVYLAGFYDNIGWLTVAFKLGVGFSDGVNLDFHREALVPIDRARVRQIVHKFKQLSSIGSAFPFKKIKIKNRTTKQFQQKQHPKFPFPHSLSIQG
jgi:hypothetical protein